MTSYGPGSAVMMTMDGLFGSLQLGKFIIITFAIGQNANMYFGIKCGRLHACTNWKRVFVHVYCVYVHDGKNLVQEKERERASESDEETTNWGLNETNLIM